MSLFLVHCTQVYKFLPIMNPLFSTGNKHMQQEKNMHFQRKFRKCCLAKYKKVMNSATRFYFFIKKYASIYSLVWKLAGVYERGSSRRRKEILSVTLLEWRHWGCPLYREVYSLVWKLAGLYERGGVGWGRRCYRWHFGKTTLWFSCIFEKYILWVWKLAVYEGGGVGGGRCYWWLYLNDDIEVFPSLSRIILFGCENWRYMKEEE